MLLENVKLEDSASAAQDTSAGPAGGLGSAKSRGRGDFEKCIAQLDAADAAVPQNPVRVLETEADQVEGQGESFVQLYKEALAERDFKIGDVVSGTVSQVHDKHAVVDIAYKSEGVVLLSEFRNQKVVPGDKVQVLIERLENENGMVVLSKERADMLRAWDSISKVAENQEVIEGTVIAKVKGGLSVDIGVKAFLPGSQIDVRPVWDMDQFVGKPIKCKVIKFNKKRGNIVLSRRVILEAERSSLKSITLETVKEGAVVPGVVKNVTDYGAFIDLGGIDGLLHITDMSWGRLQHPSEILKPGDDIKVKVLNLDLAKERVSLGLKQIEGDPWAKVAETYSVGQKVHGRVVGVVDYGIFVEVERGVEGLVHMGEVSWSKLSQHPSQLFRIGQEIDVIILDIDVKARRISLSHKQLTKNPWLDLEEKFPKGSIVEGEVRRVTDFGVFVNIDQDVNGLVHVSDISWSHKSVNPPALYKKGDKISVVILGVDAKNERFSLGVKQLEPDSWASIEEKYPVGSRHDVTVVRLVDYGAFVSLEKDVEGLIHISEIAPKRVEKAEDELSVGQVVRAEVISLDKEAHKLGLSAKQVLLHEGREESAELMRKQEQEEVSASLGDVLGGALGAGGSVGETNKEAAHAKAESNTSDAADQTEGQDDA